MVGGCTVTNVLTAGSAIVSRIDSFQKQQSGKRTECMYLYILEFLIIPKLTRNTDGTHYLTQLLK